MKKFLIMSLTTILTCACISPIMASASEVKSTTNTSNQIVADFKETNHDFYIAKANTAPLTDFGINNYSNGKYRYEKSIVANIKKSTLKDLNFETIQTGNGRISYLSIDGNEVSSSDFDYNKTPAGTNWGGVTKWKTNAVIKNRTLSDLSTGKHTVKAVCSGDKWDVHSRVITDTFTFNLVD